MDATAQTLLAQLRGNPLDRGLLTAVREHSERTGDFSVWADALELHARTLAAAEGDPAELGQLHFELGNLYRDQLSRPDRAIAHYRTAIDFDAAQRPAIAAARGIFQSAGKWDQVATLLDREAESLPRGPKRAGLLVELAGLYKRELGMIASALDALREAVRDLPDDLHVRHELATLLLEQADRDADTEAADSLRREAADVLCQMTQGVSDDYAFAYLEAALDSVPDHGRSLELLEQLAPRLGRIDAIAPRWVAGLQVAPDGPLSRDLRLKLARAYDSLGQTRDAQACLAPLVARGDTEARALVESLSGAVAVNVETLPDDADPMSGEPSRAAQIASDLESLRPSEPDVASPLDDLARLARASATDKPLEPGEDLASAELPLVPSTPRARSTDTLPGVETTVGSASVATLLEPAKADVAASVRAALAQVPNESDDLRDAHSELTQPRAHTDLPDEARASSPDLAEAALGGAPQVPVRTSELAPASRGEAGAHGAAPSNNAPVSDLGELRKELERRVRVRDRRGAAEVAESILAHDAADADAVAAIEEHCRATRDFKRIHQLAMSLAHEPGVPLEGRLARLREAAMLSESRLGNLEGALSAWRALLSLRPDDEEGIAKLRKLLMRNARWDELAQLVEHTASSATDLKQRANFYRELAEIHRDKREAPEDAIKALESARDADPSNADDAVALSDLLVRADRFGEAATLYEAQLARTEGTVERVALLRTLAELYELKLSDDARALEVTDALLGMAPRDVASVERLERIGERTKQPERIIESLTRKLDLVEPGKRPELHARMAQVALEQLRDGARAVQFYRDALSLAPADTGLRERAAEAFESMGCSDELTAFLRELADHARDPALKIALLREVGQRHAHEGRIDDAISAYEALLGSRLDPEALSALVELLRKTSRTADLLSRLDGLARVSEPAHARDLRLERAQLFIEKLERYDAAKTELERVLRELDPHDVPVLELLSDLAKKTGDAKLHASTQEQLMALAPNPEAMAELAEKLADVYEHELKDDDGAIRVLEAWTAATPSVPQPYLRVVPLYERTGREAELQSALDALVSLAVSEDEASELLLRAARVAIQRGDHDGAWNRLVPRVVNANDVQAEELLCELARQAGRGAQLAELYVGLAQREQEPAAQTRRWMDAAEAYESLAKNPEKALEATLRALAKDLDNGELLDQADRLAKLASAWPRLGQVYDALVRRAETVEARVSVLMRHAGILEHEANDLSAAFDRVSLAFQLDPNGDETYGEAKRLAAAADRGEELLALHERRATFAQAASDKVEALLEACSIAQHVMSDPPRATGYLSRAVAAVGNAENLLDAIEMRVRELDRAQPPIDKRGLTHALTEVYKLRAEEIRREPKLATLLLSLAAAIYRDDLDDLGSAYRALEQAAALSPNDETVLDALYEAAERAGRFEALAEHLQKLADDAIDSATASEALTRLGALQAGPLASPARAAEVYKQLVTLKPRDQDAEARLRDCLKAAGRHKDLLMAIDRKLGQATSNEEKLPLLREAAQTWEVGLAIRFEARDAWKKVLALAPDDAEAKAAVERLEARPSVDEDSLLESGLVVLPEDLSPSTPAPELTKGPSDRAEYSGIHDTPLAPDNSNADDQAQAAAPQSGSGHPDREAPAPQSVSDEPGERHGQAQRTAGPDDRAGADRARDDDDSPFASEHEPYEEHVDLAAPTVIPQPDSRAEPDGHVDPLVRNKAQGHGVTQADPHGADVLPEQTAASRVTPAPPVPWAQADEPSHPFKVASPKPLSELGAELPSVVDALEDDQVELETIEEDSVLPDRTGPGNPDASARSPGVGSSHPPKPRLPPPPPSVWPRGSGVPPRPSVTPPRGPRPGGLPRPAHTSAPPPPAAVPPPPADATLRAPSVPPPPADATLRAPSVPPPPADATSQSPSTPPPRTRRD